MLVDWLAESLLDPVLTGRSLTIHVRSTCYTKESSGDNKVLV